MLCLSPKEHRDTMAGGEVSSRPITGAVHPSKAHLYVTRGEQEQKSRWGMQTKDQKEGTAYQTCSRRVWAPLSRCETHQDESTLEYLLDWWELLLKIMGHIMRCRRRTFQECTGFTMGCLGEDLKIGKGRNSGDLGRNKCEKNRGIRG